MKMEREQHQTEIRDLQDQLSEMHDELDSAKRAEDGERELLIQVNSNSIAAAWTTAGKAAKPVSEKFKNCFWEMHLFFMSHQRNR